VDAFEKATPRTHIIYSILIIAAVLAEIAHWISSEVVQVGTRTTGIGDALIVQHCIFGGVLLIELHPAEDPVLAFVDLHGDVWQVSFGWLLLKFAEGPEGMRFHRDKEFRQRQGGILFRIATNGGRLQEFY